MLYKQRGLLWTSWVWPLINSIQYLQHWKHDGICCLWHLKSWSLDCLRPRRDTKWNKNVQQHRNVVFTPALLFVFTAAAVGYTGHSNCIHKALWCVMHCQLSYAFCTFPLAERERLNLLMMFIDVSDLTVIYCTAAQREHTALQFIRICSFDWGLQLVLVLKPRLGSDPFNRSSTPPLWQEPVLIITYLYSLFGAWKVRDRRTNLLLPEFWIAWMFHDLQYWLRWWGVKVEFGPSHDR